MSQAIKRVSASSVNWAKLNERLTPHHANELKAMKGQNSIYSSQLVLFSHVAIPYISYT
jgi:hypothetical protein